MTNAEQAGRAITAAEMQDAYMRQTRLRWFLMGSAGTLLLYAIVFWGFIYPLQANIEKTMATIVQQRDSAMAENAALRAELQKIHRQHSDILMLPNPLPTETEQ